MYYEDTTHFSSPLLFFMTFFWLSNLDWISRPLPLRCFCSLLDAEVVSAATATATATAPVALSVVVAVAASASVACVVAGSGG